MKRQRAKFGRLTGGATRCFGTLQVKFLVNDPDRSPMSSLRITMKPNASHPPLWHAKTGEFFLLLAGSTWAKIDGRVRRLKAGDFVFMPPRTVHEFRAGKRGVEVLVIFSPAMNFKKPDIVLRKTHI